MKPISVFLLFFLLLCSACSPQKQLNRLLEHHPELTVSDTVRFRDTVAIPAASADTFVDLKMMTDTVIIEKERLLVKLFKQQDTLYIEGKCAADTIYRELRIPVEKVRYIKAKPIAYFPGKWLWILATVVVITILFKIRKC